MKKVFILLITLMGFAVLSCSGPSDKPVTPAGSATTAGPDSAANNGVLPPPASPNNANNSSLADTTYKAKDSLRK